MQARLRAESGGSQRRWRLREAQGMMLELDFEGDILSLIQPTNSYRLCVRYFYSVSKL